MKNIKLLLFTIALCFCTCITVNAKSCSVISGTGTKLGDVISCGGEEFYVLDNNGKQINMISKYNLFVGKKIDKTKEFLYETYKNLTPEKADWEIEKDAYDDAMKLYVELQKTYGDNVILTKKVKLLDNNIIDKVGVFSRVYTDIEYTKVKQDSKAKGLTISNRYTVYPIYGSTTLDDNDIATNGYDANGDLILETSSIYNYLTDYVSYLNSLNVNVNNVDLLRRARLNNILTELNGRPIDVYETIEDTFASITDVEEDYNPVYKFNIQNLIPEKYSWLYQTTFWVGSGSYDTGTDDFLTTNGDYCSAARGCNQIAIGIGVRPVININVSELNDIVEEVNPDTSDNIISYIIVLLLSLSTIGIIFYNKKLCF